MTTLKELKAKFAQVRDTSKEVSQKCSNLEVTTKTEQAQQSSLMQSINDAKFEAVEKDIQILSDLLKDVPDHENVDLSEYVERTQNKALLIAFENVDLEIYKLDDVNKETQKSLASFETLLKSGLKERKLSDLEKRHDINKKAVEKYWNLIPLPKDNKNEQLQNAFKAMKSKFDTMKEKAALFEKTLKKHKDKDNSLDGKIKSYEMIVMPLEFIIEDFEEAEKKYKDVLDLNSKNALQSEKEQLEKAKASVNQQCDSLAERLVEFNKYLSSYGENLSKELKDKYTKISDGIRDNNLEILKKAEKAQTPEQATKAGEKIEALLQEFQQHQEYVNKEIIASANDKVQKSLNKLEKLSNFIDKEEYQVLEQQINAIKPINIDNIQDNLNKLEKLNAEVDSKFNKNQRKVEHTNLVNEMINIVKENGSAKAFADMLQTQENHSQVHKLLNETAKQGVAPDAIIKKLREVSFQNLSDQTILGIKEFSENKNASPQLTTIQNKCEFHERLLKLPENDRILCKKYIDDSNVVYTARFLNNHGIKLTDAIKRLSDPQLKENILKIIDLHDHGKLMSQDMSNILSSDIKIQAINTLYGMKDRFDVWDDKVFPALIKDIIAKDESTLAQAILNIKDNEKLYTPFFLSVLVDANGMNKARLNIIEKLNSEHSSDYQKLAVHLLQCQTLNSIEESSKFANALGNLNEKSDMTLLVKLFDGVNEVFNDALKGETSLEEINKAKECKFKIFAKFLSPNMGIEECKTEAIKIVAEDYKDNRSTLKKLLDGLNVLWQWVSNIGNKEKQNEIIDAVKKPRIEHTFKERLSNIKSASAEQTREHETAPEQRIK